jgi:predicted nuclease of predicted toxin-antitoxin system
MKFSLAFFADESVEKRIVEALRKNYTVHCGDELLKGAADAYVLENAEMLKTILLTADKDFGELVYQR